MSIIDRFWKQLISTRFVILLLITLAVASIGGIVLLERFPVGFAGAGDFYRERMGATQYSVFVALGLFDPFRSWWFNGLLLMLAASLVACSVHRLGTTFRAAFHNRFRTSARELASFRNHFEAPLVAPVDLDTVRGVLRRAGYGVREKVLEASGAIGDVATAVVATAPRAAPVALTGTRGGLSHLGPYLTHVGLLALIIGGVITGLAGHSGMVWLAPGDHYVAEGGFELHLDDFEVVTNERGAIADYVSTVRVVEEGREVRSMAIEVNRPLRHEGVNFYQSSYRSLPRRARSVTLVVQPPAGADGSASSQRHGGDVRPASTGAVQPATADLGAASGGDQATHPTTLTLPWHEAIPVPGTDLAVALVDFTADFRMQGGEVVSASTQMRNPAAKIVVYDAAGAPVGSTWLFANHPGFGSDLGDAGQVQLAGLLPSFETGLHVTTCPGIPFIWAGFLVSSIGLVLAFYFTHRRIWILIEDDTLHVAGISAGSRRTFKEEFARLQKQLEQSLDTKARRRRAGSDPGRDPS